MKCRKCGKNVEILSILPNGLKTTICCDEYAIIQYHHKHHHKNDTILNYYN